VSSANSRKSIPSAIPDQSIGCAVDFDGRTE